MAYYKAVENVNGALKSVIARPPGFWPIIIDTTVVYQPHQWCGAVPHLAHIGYHPTAFVHLDYLHRWCDIFSPMPTLEIWRCRVSVIHLMLPGMLSLEPLWRWNKIVPITLRWPSGTVMAENIMLLERIE